MSTYKKFLSSDIIINPFEVNKSFSYLGVADLTGSEGGVDRFLGEKTNETTFISGTWLQTGEIATEYRYLIYNSVKELYYSNFTFTSSSKGTSYLESGSFYNYPQSDLYYRKYFPTNTGSVVGVISVPSKLYGNRIQPKSFLYKSGSDSITDDGEGNLIYNNSICGNIIYNQGLAIITSDGTPGNLGGETYGEATYGSSTYGGLESPTFIQDLINEAEITCSFSSSFDIFETQYKCTINANEFNYSLNPSLLTDNLRGQNKILDSGSAVYSNFVTSSDFSPFVTNVGLYNENQELVAVGKLSQPLPTSQTTDTTIFINIDR